MSIFWAILDNNSRWLKTKDYIYINFIILIMVDLTQAGTYISIIIAIVSLVVSIFWNQKLQKDQYKIQYRLIFVKEIYPPLAEDIRNSIILIHQYSQNNIVVDCLFNNLKKLYASEQIEFIKSDSPSLFNNLDCIIDLSLN
jgi:hypothetical protein